MTMMMNLFQCVDEINNNNTSPKTRTAFIRNSDININFGITRLAW